MLLSPCFCISIFLILRVIKRKIFANHLSRGNLSITTSWLSQMKQVHSPHKCFRKIRICHRFVITKVMEKQLARPLSDQQKLQLILRPDFASQGLGNINRIPYITQGDKPEFPPPQPKMNRLPMMSIPRCLSQHEDLPHNTFPVCFMNQSEAG